MAEEVKIHPGVVIGAGLLLGVGGILLYTLTARAAPPVLPGLANLYGRVTDAKTGNPVAGVLVTLNGMSVYTDSGGNYAFLELTPSSYMGSASKDGYEAYFMADIVLVEGNNELNISLVPIPLPSATVTGTMKDEVTRQPLAGVSVTINGYEAYTNGNGVYEISNIIPGTYDITFSKAGYYPAGWTLEITGYHRISYVLYPIS